MRRSAVVQVTLLPMLATAAIAAAQPGPVEPAPSPDPVLSPPGMTPSIDELTCENDPNWELRTDCEPSEPSNGIAVVRGGFGTYFWSGGG